MSGGLVPSKSTVYVSNLPFSLTNNDLHQIFEKYGKVVKVTIVKDRERRQSKGVAFVLFLERESAHLCIKALNNKELFGRTLKCSIAKDNGRATEFIKRKTYADKSRCYECGEEGHLSYDCPQNQLGDRVHPKKKEKLKGKKRKFQSHQKEHEEEEYEDDDDDDEGEDPALESLSSAIQYQQQLIEKERFNQVNSSDTSSTTTKRTRFRQSSYLSDDEEIEED